ncbi:MAG: SPFH domain-containing protein [Rhodospirillales bacterium]
MSAELEHLERRKNEAAQLKAERKAQAELAERKRRRRVKIEIAAFILSAVGVVFVLYYDTTKVADDFFAVHLRFGKIVDVHDGGRIYRVPLLDKVALIDKGARPAPALRRTVKSANDVPVAYEALIYYSVGDPEKYWARFHGADIDAAKLVSQTVEAASRRAVAALDDKQVAAPDAAKTIAAAATDTANRDLADAGIALRDLRFVGLRLIQ